MAKFEVSKSLEAVKLNKRTGIPLTEPPITISYGAILDQVEEVGDYYKFTYLMERYQMKRDSARGALHRIEDPRETAAPPKASLIEASSPEEKTTGTPGPVLEFERLQVSGGPAVSRARVPGGWLIASAGGAVTFVPDAHHHWTGGSQS